MGSLGGQGDAKAALCGRQSLPLASSVPSKTNAELGDGAPQKEDEVQEARCMSGALETQRQNLVSNLAQAPDGSVLSAF